MLARRCTVLVGLVFVVGCVSVPRVAPPAPAPPPSYGGSSPPSSPDVDALEEAIYAGSLTLGDAEARAREVLARHPDSGGAHEVAAYLAHLRGDEDASWIHFMRAAADLSSDATALYLWELSGDGPRAQYEELERLLSAIEQRHRDPAVRGLATYWHARLVGGAGRLAEAEALLAPLQLVRDWQVLGALDNDQGKGFLTAYSPEAKVEEKVDVAAEVAGPLVPLRWRRVERMGRLGTVPLADMLWPRDAGVAYLATWVKSDRERAAQLRLTSPAPVRAWCNGGLVLSDEHVEAGDFDNLIARVKLHAGWNQILIKSAQKHGDWRLRARFTDETGAPLDGIVTTATPRAFTPSPGPSNDDTDSVPGFPPSQGPKARQAFVAARLAARDGRHRVASSKLQELLASSPGALLVQYYGALADWDTGELGKAIDLFDHGVAAEPRAGAFLVKRARYYVQKQLYDKAQSDLQAAVALGPEQRRAQLDLADLYERRGWHVDRLRVLERTLRRWPDWQHALEERAQALSALGYDDEAERAFRRAQSVDPGWPAGLRGRFDLALRRHDLSSARRLLDELERLDPTVPEWSLRRGELERRLGRIERARAAFERAARMAPEWPRPLEHLADLLYEVGRTDEAAPIYARARERDPNNSFLAQRHEFLKPTRLGAIDALVPGDAEIDRALSAKVQALPGAQVVLRLDHEITEVHTDGSARRVITEVSEAIDEHGRDALTHTRLPSHGTLKVLRAYSVDARGERQEASSIRGAEVRFRNLQVGSKLVLQYVHYAPAERFLGNAWAATWFFQSPNRQHENGTWVLLTPRGRTVHEEIHGPVTVERASERDQELRTYHAQHVAPLVPEQLMSPVGDLLARVEVSTVESWDAYVRWERALLADAFHTNPKLDALADKLLAGKSSPREKLDALYHHVTQEVRYQQDYEDTIAGVRPHAAPVVDERGYGDCKDKAVLLIQLGRRAGLRLDFAILRTTRYGHISREVPNQQFNHAIVYVPVQAGIEQPFFLDPTSDGLDVGNLRSDDQGATALVMEPESGAWQWREIPYQAPEVDYDTHTIKISVKSATEASATDEMSLRGQGAMVLRHWLRSGAQAKKLFEMLAAILFPGTTVKESHADAPDDTWRPLTLSMEMDVSASIKPQDRNFRLALPGAFKLAQTMSLKKRETPLHLGPPDSERYDIEVLLPAGSSVVHAPVDFTVEHSCFTLKRTAHVAEGRLGVRIDYTRRCAHVEVASYPEFRDAVQRAVRSFDDEVVFGAKEEPAPPRKARR